MRLTNDLAIRLPVQCPGELQVGAGWSLHRFPPFLSTKHVFEFKPGASKGAGWPWQPKQQSIIIIFLKGYSQQNPIIQHTPVAYILGLNITYERKT